MINRDIKIDIRTETGVTGPHNTPTYSIQKLVYGQTKETSAEEKVRAASSGEVNISRVDINEESYADETVAYLGGQTTVPKRIYKAVKSKNKVFLYLSDQRTTTT